MCYINLRKEIFPKGFPTTSLPMFINAPTATEKNVKTSKHKNNKDIKIIMYVYLAKCIAKFNFKYVHILI